MNIPDEWVAAAMYAYYQSESPNTSDRLASALTAVAPAIAKAEREVCARLVEDFPEPGGLMYDEDARHDIAAAIRAGWRTGR